jgi:hypothetical protein
MISNMPGGEGPQDIVTKFLSDKKALEDKRQTLIKDLLAQKEAAIRDFDEKLAKLGYQADHHPKRSHHSKDAQKKDAQKKPSA